MKDISEASTDFALSLLRKLSDESSGENVLFSPASISVALTMAYAGAANNTKKEMENVLFGGLADEAVQEAFGELVKTLNRQSDSYALHAANRLYAQQDFDFKREFLELCEKVYQSSLRAVDFKKSARGVAGEINGWVAAATKDRIRGLIPDGLLSHMTRLVLVNAIYFKGTWASRFNEDFTRKEAFHLAPGKDLVVDTMHKKARFGYAEDAKVQVLRMAYKGGGRLAMFIFLPKERFGLRDWLHNVNGTGLRKLMESCCSENEIIIFEVRREAPYF